MRDNIPVRMTVHLAFHVGGEDSEEEFVISSNGGVGVVNPFEHETPASFLADCQHTTRRLIRELHHATAGDSVGDDFGAPLAAAVENYVKQLVDAESDAK